MITEKKEEEEKPLAASTSKSAEVFVGAHSANLKTIGKRPSTLPEASTASPSAASTSKPPSEDKQSKPETPTAFCTPTVSGKAS